MIFGIKNTLLVALLATPAVSAFSPAAAGVNLNGSQKLDTATVIHMSSQAAEDGAGMKSFSLTPDQGVGTTMNPRYQIDKGSVYPKAVLERRRNFSAASNSFRSNKQESSSSSSSVVGGAAFRSSPDFHMWDGTNGMSRRPIDPESHYPMGMMSFSRQSAATAAVASPPPPSAALPEAPKAMEDEALAGESSSSSALATPSPSENIEKPPMTKEEQREYAQALRARAGQNHFMWDGTTGMSRQPINPSSSYPRGMRHGMW